MLKSNTNVLAVVYFIDKSQLSECHIKSGNLDKAIDILRQCIDIFEQHMPAARSHLCLCKC